MKETAFSRNFNALFNLSGKTQDEVATAIGVDRLTIYNWRNGRTSKPKSNEITERLKDYFNVTESELFGYNDGFYAKTFGLSDKPPGAIAPDLQPRKAYAPLLGRVHAGDAEEPEIIDDCIQLPYSVWESHKNGYFLEVEGTCMNKVYPPGCHIFVDPNTIPQNGSIAVVSIDGSEFVMRRLHRGATALMLSPESYDQSWEDIVVTGDHEVRMVGTVVWFQSSKEMD